MSILEKVIIAQNKMYALCKLKIDDFFPEKESSDYFAHTFAIQEKQGLFRIAKKTPTKSGFFVTLWKRALNQNTAPYDNTDAIDFVIVAVAHNEYIGEFIFPKSILLQKNIFSTKEKEGKRGFRVYTPWDKTTSAQAAKTQKWQSSFYVGLNQPEPETIQKIKTLYYYVLNTLK